MRLHPSPVLVALAASLLGLLPIRAADPKKDDLPPEDPNANKLTDEEAKDGWKLLFDGTKLIGLRGLKNPDPLKSGWTVDRNSLALPKSIKTQDKATGGDLLCAYTFDDFDFRFDFRVAVSADSGIVYFGRAVMGQKPTGHEYQIIDDVHNPDGLKGGEIKRTGSLYGILPRADGTSIRVGERWNEEEWNHGRIVVQGKHVEHWLNNQKCLEYDLGPDLLKQAAAQNVKLPAGFGTKMKSPIIILDQGKEVAFRNLKIRPLAPPAATAPAPATPRATLGNPTLQPPGRLTPAPR